MIDHLYKVGQIVVERTGEPEKYLDNPVKITAIDGFGYVTTSSGRRYNRFGMSTDETYRSIRSTVYMHRESPMLKEKA